MQKIIMITTMLLLSTFTYLFILKKESISAPHFIVVLCIGILVGLLIAAIGAYKKAP